jgi:magnesium transporter
MDEHPPSHLAAHLSGKSTTPFNPSDPIPETGLTWIHLEAVSAPEIHSAINIMVETFPLTASDFFNDYLRLGVEYRPEGFALLCSIPTCAEQPKYRPIAFFATTHCLLTIAQEHVPEFSEEFEAWQRNPQEVGKDIGHLLFSLLDISLDSYFPLIDLLNDQIDDLEAQIFEQPRTNPTDALKIKRQLLNIRKQVSPVRENINSIIRHGQPIVKPVQLPEYQDLYNHSLRIAENLDLGRDLLAGLIDIQLSITSNRLNEVMRTLTVISTVLMTAALIAGIYGMNFQIPELHWTHGYAFAIGLMIVSSTGIVIWFRKAGIIEPKEKD